jgi:glycosyltransferase involved in cell wall biosynthesis
VKQGVLHLIDSGGFYGAEAVILNLCIGLKEAGFKSIIGCFKNAGAPKPELGRKAESLALDVEYIVFRNKLDFTAIKQVREIAERRKVALIHSHGYKPSFFCLLLYALYRIPYVITCHLWLKETFRARFYILLDRISMVFARKVIAVSYPIARDIFSWRRLRKKVTVINNGIDINKYADYRANFSPTQLRQELGLKENTRLVGTLGRLTHQKAHHYLIEAARIVFQRDPGVEFLVAGEGHRLGYLKELVGAYGISRSFHFVGYRSDAVNILKLLDVFVLCSIDEGLPIVLLEAMSVGVPVVATDVGEIPQVIRNLQNGILVRRGSVRGLAEAILRVLNDQILGNSLPQNAKKTIATKFSISRMTQDYVNVYWPLIS